MEWQPIETCNVAAWEDVLIYDTDGDVGMGYRADDGEWYISTDALSESPSEPTHWMPLPSPPQDS